MKDNKGTTVLLTVIGIATLLVAVVGATFAFFSATVNETYTDSDDADVVVEAATLGTVTFTHGQTIDLCEDGVAPENCKIYPGAQEAKTFKVTADPASTQPVEYTVWLNITGNNFVTDNLGYKVSAKTTEKEEGDEFVESTLPTFATEYTSLNTLKEGYTQKINLGTATLGTAGVEDEWTLDIRLDNLPTNQKDDQGKIFNAVIEVELTNNIYSETYTG